MREHYFLQLQVNRDITVAFKVKVDVADFKHVHRLSKRDSNKDYKHIILPSSLRMSKVKCYILWKLKNTIISIFYMSAYFVYTLR